MTWLILNFISAHACESWGPVTELRDLSHPDLEESSGLAASRATPGALWTHDDSGAEELFRFTLDGEVTKHDFPQSKNDDWEDIATADCPRSGNCLYVGDIGGERDDIGTIEVYVGREPRGDGPITLVETWNLTWPTAPRDVETLLVHPCTLDAWIVTREDTTEVFRIPDSRGPKPSPLIPIGILDIDEPITSGDFAPDGSALVLRSDTAVYRYMVDADDLDAHWAETPERLFELTRTGEAIAWEPDGDLLVTDEGQPTPIGRIACEQAPPEVCKAPVQCGCSFSPSLGWAWLRPWARRPG